MAVNCNHNTTAGYHLYPLKAMKASESQITTRKNKLEAIKTTATTSWKQEKRLQ